MEIDTLFYIVGIVFMVIMLLFTAALLVAVFVIRSKVLLVERLVQRRVTNMVKLTSSGSVVAYVLRYLFNRRQRRHAG